MYVKRFETVLLALVLQIMVEAPVLRYVYKSPEEILVMAIQFLVKHVWCLR